MRVWSWLRMNAGGVLNTCKSNGLYMKPSDCKVSGGRVSNAWITCPVPGDNSWKRLLIPHKRTVPHGTVHLQIITFIGAGICDMPEISAGKSTYTSNQQGGGKNQYPLRNLFPVFCFCIEFFFNPIRAWIRDFMMRIIGQNEFFFNLTRPVFTHDEKFEFEPEAVKHTCIMKLKVEGLSAKRLVINK